MNTSYPFYMATIWEKIVTAVCSAVVEHVVESDGVLWGIALLFGGIAARRFFNNTGLGPGFRLRQAGGWRLGGVSRQSGGLSGISAKWISGLACLVFFAIPWYLVFGKAVEGRISAKTNEPGGHTVVILPEPVTDRLGEAEVLYTDDSGVFHTKIDFGNCHFLLLKLTGGVLLYSNVIRPKGIFPMDVAVEPNFREAPLVWTKIDRFLFDRDGLPGYGGDRLGKLHDLKLIPDHCYLIIGHTDAVGPKAHNKRLGKMRAKAAAEHLESLGVPRHHILIASAGSDHPVDRSQEEHSRYEKGEPLDRRVEIFCIPNPYVPPVTTKDGTEVR